MGNWYVLHGINPEPWKVGPITIGRSKIGKLFSVVGQDQQLRSFQDAVREAMKDGIAIEGPLELKFFFWRRLDSYTGARKEITKHEVDATNMQKATEDALQGILMKNDNLVKRISSTVVEQGTEVSPKIVIFAEPWSIGIANYVTEIPADIWAEIDKEPVLEQDSNVWPPRS